jgi:hypothetical protein
MTPDKAYIPTLIAYIFQACPAKCTVNIAEALCSELQRPREVTRAAVLTFRCTHNSLLPSLDLISASQDLEPGRYGIIFVYTSHYSHIRDVLSVKTPSTNTLTVPLKRLETSEVRYRDENISLSR